MPTKRESNAPIQSVSVPTRTICTTARWRSVDPARSERRTAKKRDVASPSTWRTSRMVAPRRAKGLRPGERGSASTAMGRSPLARGRPAEVEVYRAEQAAVLAGDEAPEEVPVVVPVGLRLPAEDAVEGGPDGQDPAVPGEHAVGERRGLAGAL